MTGLMVKPAELLRSLFGLRGERRQDINFFLRDIRGVIHIGANTGAERKIYAKHGLEVLWVEPLPKIFSELKENISRYPSQRALRYLVTDFDDKEYIFHVSSNDGASSSIFEPALHRNVWPHVYFTETLALRSVTLKSLVKLEHIDIGRYQGLVLDTQGSELLILRGAGELLAGLSYIRTEAADFEAYAGCCRIEDITTYLKAFGFREVLRRPFNTKPGVGTYFDVIYRKGEA
jgi:FkbM family methyltransferase